MKFKEFITESTINIYHGDNYNTTKIDPKLMLQKSGNAQEGVGI